MKSDDFIREVEEELQRDRFKAAWNRYGAVVITVAVALVIGTGGGVGWRAYRDNQRIDEAMRYETAERLLLDGAAAEAATAFGDVADDASAGYSAIARLREAEAAASASDNQARTDVLNRLADDDDVDALYRDLAGLLAVDASFDDNEPGASAERLEKYSVSGGPWRYSAREMLALAQLRQGDRDGARDTLTALVDDAGTPVNLRRRADELLAALGGPDRAEDASQ